MKLTYEDFAAVAAYEKQIISAVQSHFLRNVGRSGLAVLVPIYERATGAKWRVNDTCGACILDFLQRIGKIYLADKEERERQAQEAAAAAPVSEAAATPAKRGRRAKKQ